MARSTKKQLHESISTESFGSLVQWYIALVTGDGRVMSIFI